MKRVLIVVVVLAFLAAVVVGCAGGGAKPLVGYQRQPVPSVEGLSLPDVTSGDTTDFVFRGPDGGLLLVYFGYTSCPDACPTTLSDIRATIESLDGFDRSRLEVAMVTIDPEVDTPELLTGYVQSFVSQGRAVRSDDVQELKKVTGAFGADFDKIDDEVIHTGSLYGINDRAQLVITWPFGVSAGDLESDVRQLLQADA